MKDLKLKALLNFSSVVSHRSTCSRVQVIGCDGVDELTGQPHRKLKSSGMDRFTAVTSESFETASERVTEASRFLATLT